MGWKATLCVLAILAAGCSQQTAWDPPSDTLPSVGNNGILEEGVIYRYRFQIHCGMEWLVGFNGIPWKTDEPITQGTGAISDELRIFLVNPDEVISPELWTYVTLLDEDTIRVSLPDTSRSSIYYPSDEEWPGCA